MNSALIASLSTFYIEGMVGIEERSKLILPGKLLKNACPGALGYWGFDMKPEMFKQ